MCSRYVNSISFRNKGTPEFQLKSHASRTPVFPRAASPLFPPRLPPLPGARLPDLRLWRLDLSLCRCDRQQAVLPASQCRRQEVHRLGRGGAGGRPAGRGPPRRGADLRPQRGLPPGSVGGCHPQTPPLQCPPVPEHGQGHELDGGERSHLRYVLRVQHAAAPASRTTSCPSLHTFADGYAS
jgi:hypothetical protein